MVIVYVYELQDGSLDFSILVGRLVATHVALMADGWCFYSLVGVVVKLIYVLVEFRCLDLVDLVLCEAIPFACFHAPLRLWVGLYVLELSGQTVQVDGCRANHLIRWCQREAASDVGQDRYVRRALIVARPTRLELMCTQSKLTWRVLRLI